MTTTPARVTFLAAPVFLLLGVLGMKLGWKANPDLAWSTALPLWTAAHFAYIIGNLAIFVVLTTLWRVCREAARSTAERVAVTATAVVGAVGTVTMTGQMVIDLIVGFRADSRSGMPAISRSIQELPGFETFFYGVIPALGLAAVAVLAVVGAVRRQLPVWAATIFFVASVGIGTGVTAVMIAGGAVACVSLPAMTRGERPAGSGPKTIGADRTLTRS